MKEKLKTAGVILFFAILLTAWSLALFSQDVKCYNQQDSYSIHSIPYQCNGNLVSNNSFVFTGTDILINGIPYSRRVTVYDTTILVTRDTVVIHSVDTAYYCNCDTSGGGATLPLTQGVYWPVISDSFNIQQVVQDSANYYTIGNMVTVFGFLNIEHIDSGVITYLKFSLPLTIPPLGDDKFVGGTLGGIVDAGIIKYGDFDKAYFLYTPRATLAGAQNFSYTFSYRRY